MADYSFTCTDAASTAALGAALGPLLKRGDLVLFYGDLGAGKTTLIRGLIQSLCLEATEVVSPTFTLVQTYPAKEGTIYHYDLYRLAEGQTSALEELGWDDGLMTGISLVEWPERLGGHIPSDALAIHLDTLGGDLRRVHFNTNDNWETRLAQLRKDVA